VSAPSSLGQLHPITPARAWLSEVTNILERIDETQSESIEQASVLFAETIGNGGLVHMFGTGHSRIPIEEMFPRYGSFAGFNPIVELSMTFHTDVVGSNGHQQAMFIERAEGLAEVILDGHRLAEGDGFLLFSVSGRNAVPVEMARGARRRGLPVVAVTAVEHSLSVASRHSSGTRLLDHASIVIDLCTPVGDAIVELEGADAPIGPTTTMAAVAVANMLRVRVAELLTAGGATLPVLRVSGCRGFVDDGSSAVYADHERRLFDPRRS
jgi:uncharacterized phosphosugar-binding protein